MNPTPAELSVLHEALKKAHHFNRMMAAIFFASMIASLVFFNVFNVPVLGGLALVICVLSFITAIFATSREHKAFKAYWLATGLSPKDVQDKWFTLYPGGD